MGVSISRHLYVLGSLAPLSGCGIERDYQAWQDAAHASTRAEDPGGTVDPISTSADSIEGTTSSTSAVIADTGSTSGDSDESSAGENTETAAHTIVCGDDLREGAEECDGAGDPGCHECIRDRLVFVTSEPHSGAFAEEGDPDYLCNHLADIAGLLTDHQPRFRAWISTSTSSAAERLYHSPGRYVLVDGQVLANSWDDLTAGQLLNPPSIDELGGLREVTVWTDTLPDGRAAPDSSHCEDWTNNDIDVYASWGYSARSTAEWTQWTDQATNPTICLVLQNLYCFESP